MLNRALLVSAHLTREPAANTRGEAWRESAAAAALSLVRLAAQGIVVRGTACR